MDQKNNGMGWLGGMLIGLAVGATAGLLLAPKSGKETREDIARLANSMRDEVTNRARRLSRVTREAYNEIVDTVVRQYEEAKQITREQAGRLTQDLREGYDRVKETAQESYDDSDDDRTPTRRRRES